jgi:hypothetical protein
MLVSEYFASLKIFFWQLIYQSINKMLIFFCFVLFKQSATWNFFNKFQFGILKLLVYSTSLDEMVI